jgi:hypothetical protein
LNSPEEAGAYLATYKLYEHKSPDILKERVHNDYSSHLNRSLTGVKGINKTDVITLSTSFGVSLLLHIFLSSPYLLSRLMRTRRKLRPFRPSV